MIASLAILLIIWCPTTFYTRVTAFHLYIRDMFYDIDNCDITSYADENTSYTSDFSLEQIIQKLKLITNILLEQFKNNHMKTNADKCHSLVIRDTYVPAEIGEFDVENIREEKPLGIKIDTKLSFEKHVSSLYKKTSRKLHAIATVLSFMDLAKHKSLMKAIVTS